MVHIINIDLHSRLRYGSFLEQIHPLWLMDNEVIKIIINLNKTFIPLRYYALTASIINRVKRNNFIEVSIINPTPYASRIDFFKQVGFEFEENFKRHESTGKFLEIMKFDNSNDNHTVNEVVKIFQHKMHLDESLLGCLNYCLGEIFSNVITHAQSITGGFVVAQSYPKMNKLDIVVVDDGIGIHQSLTESEKYFALNEEEALTKCLMEGVTNGNGMGNGLYHLTRIIQENKGIVRLCSGFHTLTLQGGAQKIIRHKHEWHGTALLMTFKLSTQMDLLNIWNNEICIPTSISEWKDVVWGYDAREEVKLW